MKKNNINSNMIKNIVGAYTIKGLALIVSFFTIPMYMKYFSNDGILGVWYTILSLLSWILMFDLGIGNGLRNNLVKHLVNNDNKNIRTTISSAYFILGLCTIGIAFIGIICIGVINWNSVFNISNNIISNNILKIALLISFIGVCFQFFLKLILSILNAMEKTAKSNGLVLVSSVLNLLYLFFNFGSNDSTKLINLSIVYALSINIPLIVCTFLVFKTTLTGLYPNYSFFDKKQSYKILNLGGSFFAIQILFMLITTSNEFFISNIFGSGAVVNYQVYNKIFYTLVTFYSLISNPIWSAVSRAHSEKNYQWIKDIYKKLMILACIGICGVVFISCVLQFIVNIWLGENSIVVNISYIIPFAIYVSVMFFVFALNSIANGIQHLKPQIVIYSIAVVIKIVVLYLMKSFISSWIVIIWINALTLVPYIIWQMIDLKVYFKNLK